MGNIYESNRNNIGIQIFNNLEIKDNINIKNNLDNIKKDLDEFYKLKRLSKKTYEFMRNALDDYIKIN